MNHTFSRAPAARRKFGGIGNSTWYEWQKQCLMTPGVKLGSGRAVGWPEHELEAIFCARLAGKGDSEIRELVANLVAARSS